MSFFYAELSRTYFVAWMKHAHTALSHVDLCICVQTQARLRRQLPFLNTTFPSDRNFLYFSYTVLIKRRWKQRLHPSIVKSLQLCGAMDVIDFPHNAFLDKRWQHRNKQIWEPPLLPETFTVSCERSKLECFSLGWKWLQAKIHRKKQNKKRSQSELFADIR